MASDRMSVVLIPPPPPPPGLIRVKKEGLEKEKHIFEKKKEVYVKKEGSIYFRIFCKKKEGNTYKKRRKDIFFILK